MARPSKIVDETEARRWLLDEGIPYSEIQRMYLDKYGIETSISMWSRKYAMLTGEVRRPSRSELMPWHLKDEHREAYIAQLLRSVARQRRGVELSKNEAGRVAKLLRELEENNQVIHYDPDTKAGWWLIPREPQDDDIIRRP